MARTTTKAKEPVRFRFKTLSNGNKAIYLVTHLSGTDANHNRAYEHTGLFLVPETTKAAKVQNQNTLQAANAIKAQRLLEYANGKAGIRTPNQRGKMLLTDWMQHYKELKLQQGQSNSNALLISCLIQHLKAYRGDTVTMQQIDKRYCEGFIKYLSTAKCFARNKRTKKPVAHRAPKLLSPETATEYYNLFVYALTQV